MENTLKNCMHFKMLKKFVTLITISRATHSKRNKLLFLHPVMWPESYSPYTAPKNSSSAILVAA